MNNLIKFFKLAIKFFSFLSPIKKFSKKTKTKKTLNKFKAFNSVIKRLLKFERINRQNNKPRYLIIGRKNSGKSLLLKNSQITFVDKTKNRKSATCFIYEEANFIEHRINSGARSLSLFSQLVKKLTYTKEKQLNGVMLCVSIHDLLKLEHTQTNKALLSIYKHIDALHKASYYSLPIYLFVNHLDNLFGFNDFFSKTDLSSSSKPWGVQLEGPSKYLNSFQANYNKQFDLLINNARIKTSALLHEEIDLSTRQAIYYFPDQLNSLKHYIQVFMQKICVDTNIGIKINTNLVKNIFLTSNCQKNKERITSLIHGLKHDEDDYVDQDYSNNNKSFFVKQVLPHVLLLDKTLPILKKKYRLQAMARKLVLSLVCISALITVLVVWDSSNKIISNNLEVYSYDLNIYKEISIDEKQSLDTQKVLGLLNSSYQLTQVFSHENRISTLINGYLLNKKANSYSNSLFCSASQKYFNPVLQKIMTYHLIHDKGIDLYRTLHIYKKVFDKNEKSSKEINHWFSVNWQQGFSHQLTADQVDNLNQLFALYSKLKINSLYIKPSIISAAQEKIDQLSVSDRIYTIFSSFLDHDCSTKNIQIPSNDFNGFFKIDSNIDTIPQYYSATWFHKNYKKYSAEALKVYMENNSRNLAPQNNKAAIEQSLLSQYSKGYLQHWTDFLNNLKISSMDSVAKINDALILLGSKQSPIARMVNLINKNTQDKDLPSNIVSNRTFSILESWSKSEKGSSTFQSTMQDTQKFIAEIDQSANPNLAALNAMKQQVNSNGGSFRLSKFLNLASSSPKPIQHWLNSFAAQTTQILFNKAADSINQQWHKTVLPEFNQNLSSYYPFNKKSNQPVDVTKLNQFFSPKSSFSLFMDNSIIPLIEDPNAQVWQWKSSLDKTVPIDNEKLQQLKQLYQIQHLLYEDATGNPAMTLLLKPLYMDNSNAKFELNVNGKQLTYMHGPQLNSQIKWPGSSTNYNVMTKFTSLKGKATTHYFKGTWGLFHLLQGNVTGDSNNQYKFELNQAGNSMSYTLTVTNDGAGGLVNFVNNTIAEPSSLK